MLPVTQLVSAGETGWDSNPEVWVQGSGKDSLHRSGKPGVNYGLESVITLQVLVVKPAWGRPGPLSKATTGAGL